MARLWSSGAELKSATSDVEINIAGDAPTIETTIVHGGVASYKTVVGASGFSQWGPPLTGDVVSADVASLYARTYLYIGSSLTGISGSAHGNGDVEIFNIADIATGGFDAVVTLDATNHLRLYYFNGSTNPQIGSASSALNTGQWYRIEIGYNKANLVEAKIDGTAFATTASPTGAVSVGEVYFGVAMGGTEGYTGGTLYFDDIAVNDNTGSFQNSYPGIGQIVHLQPNAAGDNNAFTTQTGGTAGAANNFTRVDEVTPDNATTFNGDVTTGHIDDFNITDTPASIGSSDTINVVQVGVRYRASVASAESAFKVRAKKASAGTVSSSSAITPNATTWKTNANASPVTYPLTLYQDPDASAWTKATLDTAQIGYTISTGNTNRADISTIWMLVDSTPAAGGTTLTVSVADTTTTSESQNITEVDNVKPTDTTTTSETVTLQLISFVSVTDTSTTSETKNVTEVDIVSIADTSTTSETTNFQLISNISIVDTTTTSENPLVFIPTYFVTTADTTTTSETVKLQLVSFISVGDTTTTSETTSQQVVDTITIADTATTSESETMLLISSVSVADTSTTSETVTILIPTYFVTPADTTTTSETVTLQLVSFVSLSDTSTTSETTGVMQVSFVQPGDTTTTSETIALSIQDYINKSDTATTSENVIVSASPTDVVSVVDTSTTSETVAIKIPTLFIAGSDITTTAETTNIILPILPVNLNDTTTTSESQGFNYFIYPPSLVIGLSGQSMNVTLNETGIEVLNISISGETMTATVKSDPLNASVISQPMYVTIHKN